MSFDTTPSEDRELTPREVARLERQLADLGGSIVARDPLREETLRRGEQSNEFSRGRKFSARWVIAASITLMMLSPWIAAATRLPVPKSPSARQVNEAALQYARQRGLTFDWALVDVFETLREARASFHADHTETNRAETNRTQTDHSSTR
jgi:hypothetical protein